MSAGGWWKWRPGNLGTWPNSPQIEANFRRKVATNTHGSRKRSETSTSDRGGGGGSLAGAQLQLAYQLL